jgi:hypothetical protein
MPPEQEGLCRAFVPQERFLATTDLASHLPNCNAAREESGSSKVLQMGAVPVGLMVIFG